MNKIGYVVAGFFAVAVIGFAGHYALEGLTGSADNSGKRAVVSKGDNELVVQAMGVRSSEGQIVVSMCAEGQAFPDACTFKKAAAANQGETELRFKDLADGKYAIALFHDENADGQLTFQQEGIGFSNNTNLEFATPDFAKSEFAVPQEDALAINVKYFN